MLGKIRVCLGARETRLLQCDCFEFLDDSSEWNEHGGEGVNTVSLAFHNCDMDHGQMKLEVEWVYLVCYSRLPSIKEPRKQPDYCPLRNQGSNVEAEALEEQCLLVCSPLLALPAFLYHPRLNAQERHCPQCGGLSYISH